MAWHGKFRPGILLLLISFVVISEASAKALGKFEEPEERHIAAISKQYRYETAYACEGKTLKIECNDGEVIKLIRANYGRFSITICNDHGNTDWSVNCMSPKSLRVLHTRCSFKTNCSIAINNEAFGGDPCFGTKKYIEAHYTCDKATTTTTTSRPSPPWLITSQPPMWSTIKPPAARPSTTQVTIIPPSPIPGPLPSSTSVHIPSSTAEGHGGEEKDVWWNYKGNDGTNMPLTTVVSVKRPSSDTTSSYSYASSDPSVYPWPKDIGFLPFHCNSTTVRNIYWASTRANETAIQPCPPGTTGFAKWHCSDVNSSEYAQWYPENPDLSECRSVWLTSIEQRILAGKDQLVTITSELAQVTSRNLYGGDMAITTKIIQKMADKMSVDIQTFRDTSQRESVVSEMLMHVAQTSSNLLDASQDPSWKDLSFKDQMSVATSLLIGLEENAFLLADTVMNEKVVNKEFKNILLSVRVLDTKHISDETFPSEETRKNWSVSDNLIEIPKEALLENSDGNFVRLVFVAFDRLEEILLWTPDANDPSEENMTKILNSKVISASLGKGRHIQLKEPVKLTMKHIKSENVSNPKCVFWDYTMNAWSEEGCHADSSESNYTHTVCYCDHLTNFAILMDVHDIYLPYSHEIALRVITYIGCIISIICLILAIVTFQLFRGLKSDRTTIHCNLCTCLLIAEFIFLVGINQTENRIFCGVIAGFLQYFFLCAFVWMFLEGFQLYVMLIEVFEVEKSRIRWYYMLAYGLPFFIVLISASIYPQGYGTYRYCWLKTDNYFIYSFVGPVMLVMLLNVIFLTMAIVMMCKHATASASMKNKEHSRLASTRAWLKGAFVLVFLLGLTWIFGFLYINQESVVMAYLFATFNSFQGFFIFLFHCVQNEKVRKEYRKFIRKHSWLPKCLRCSKSGSGAGSSSGGSGSCTTGTGGTGKERRPSLYAGSNGNQSQGANSHSTDQSALTPHGTSLQRNWNSQSCTNVNRASCRTPVPTSTSANMAATLCRSPRGPTNEPPSPSLEPEHPNNTSTLPYIRNFYKNSLVTPNIPKSVSTWGPLHKPLHWKNISFKSYSRDSGHGGSEQEDSPRSHMVIADAHCHNTSSLARDARHLQDYYGMKATLQPHCVSTAGRKKNMKPLHWGHHTYQEIYDAQTPRSLLAAEDDPVYEEIDRNEIQVSDLSDEDARRQSDMSRQSSRSYGDHRPLIPYSPGAERQFDLQQHNKELEEYYRMRCNNIGLPTYRTPTGEATVRSLAAVLDGETVVCHLEPPDMVYPSRQHCGSFVLPPYSES